MPTQGTTRLAPSPTGALHLGNARTFVITWAIARQNSLRILLRVEDIDGPRIKAGADAQCIDDLAWLGINWDYGPIRQSTQMQRYRQAALSLLQRQAAYPCICSRSEVESAASAPHASDGATVYSGTCRGKFTSLQAALQSSGRAACLRFQMPSRTYQFTDGFRGDVCMDGEQLGDFPILKADGTPAYQLACAMDDADSGVTEVIRGDDLLDSVPRQVALLESLGWGDRVPKYTHLPLVLGPDGRRLAKRHGDTRVASYRRAGVGPGRVIQLLGKWSGIAAWSELRNLSDFAREFRLSNLPSEPVTMATEDERFLREG